MARPAKTAAVAPTYVAPPRPVDSGSLLEAAYDPFTGHYLYLTTQGGTIYLTGDSNEVTSSKGLLHSCR